MNLNKVHRSLSGARRTAARRQLELAQIEAAARGLGILGEGVEIDDRGLHPDEAQLSGQGDRIFAE